MLEILQKHIKTNIAQYTQLFDIDTQNISLDTQSNQISNAGLDGEYTLSEATEGTASVGCLNQTLDFVGGAVGTDCFFGNDVVTHNLVAHKVNVGTAIKRDIAMEMVIDEKIGNSIIVYLNSTRNSTEGKRKNTISEDLSIKVNYTLGVMFKIDASQMESIGCVNTDVVFINSVLGAGKQSSTLIQFDSVVDRFFAGKSYVVDYEFSYEDIMLFDDIIKDRVKHFDTVFDNLEL